jgi:hypothetical protein
MFSMIVLKTGTSEEQDGDQGVQFLYSLYISK